MRRLTALVATAVALTAATAAAADTGRSLPGRGVVQLQRTALDGSTVCLRGTATDGCAAYQSQLLRSVGQKAAARTTPISVNDLGRAQLNALIASIN